MAEHSEHKEESLMEKIADKIHFDRSSSSSSDSDSEVKPAAPPVKAKIWRLFGREKPVHHVLGGGKRKLTLLSASILYIHLFALSDCLWSNELGFKVLKCLKAWIARNLVE